MRLKQSIASWVGFVSCAVMCFAGDLPNGAIEGEPLPLEQLLEQVGPMNTEGLPRREATLLESFYAASLGGADNWARIHSMRFKGELRLAEGPTLQFHAYLKKPNLCKVVVFAPGSDAKMIMSYDGQDAWQSMPQAEAVAPAQAMPLDEARNFIRDAWFGGHLLYPRFPGKRIELVQPESGDFGDTFDLKVTLPDEQVVRYTLSFDGYFELARTQTNQVNGETEVITQSDFRQIEGVRVPFQSSLTSDGELVHEMNLTQADVNKGVPSWMFERPE